MLDVLSRSSRPIETVEADTAAAAARELAAGQPFDAVLLDYMLPDANGLDFLADLLAAQPDLVVILTTARGDEEIAAAAFKAGAADYVVKSTLSARLPRALEAAVDRARLRAEARHAEARIAHLNSVLLAIRNVNHLITKEKDAARLLEQACQLLTETRGYHAAWVVLLDDRDEVVEWYGSRGGSGVVDFVTNAPIEAFPACGRRTLSMPAVIHVEPAGLACVGCPLVAHDSAGADRACLSMVLAHGASRYGLLYVSLPATLSVDPDEQALFREVAEDLAFALFAIGAEAERRSSEEGLVRLNRIHAVLTRVNEAIVRVRGRDELFRDICRIAVEEGRFRMAWIGVVDPESHLVVPVAVWGHDDGYLDTVRVSIDDVPEGQGPTGRAVREGRYQLCRDFASDRRMAPWTEDALGRGYRCSAAFPFSSGKLVGAITLYSDEPRFFDDQRVGLLEALATDIGMALEREQARQRMDAYQADLRSLASQLTVAEERERRRLAVDLHDSVLQLLAFAKMKLRALTEDAGDDTAGTAAEATDLVQEAMTAGRSLISELASPEFHELGFEAAVYATAERLQRLHGLDIRVVDDGEEKPLSEEVRLTLYQAIRELLVNVIKHAHASEAEVSLRRQGDTAVVEVSDNGTGFLTSPLEVASRPAGGFGLFSLRERLRHLGGALEVQSGPDSGTTVRMTVPITSSPASRPSG